MVIRNIKQWIHRIWPTEETTPEIISLAITSRCNLKCVMCYHGFGGVAGEEFDAGLIEKLDDTFMSNAVSIDCTGLGEALMSDVFWKLLEKYPVTQNIGNDRFPICFNSNGTLLTAKNIDRILKARVGRMRISIDAADPDLYWKMRGAKLDQVLDGLKKLILTRDEIGRHYPVIGVQMTLMKSNISQVIPMIDLCNRVGVDFLEIWPLNELPTNMMDTWTVNTRNWSFSYKDNLLSTLNSRELDILVTEFHEYANLKRVAITSAIMGNHITSESFPSAGYRPLPFSFKDHSIPCSLPWKELRILANGDVYPCCWAPKPVGNLRKQRLSQIWHAKSIRNLRKQLIDGKIPDLCQGAPCPFLAAVNSGRKLEGLKIECA